MEPAFFLDEASVFFRGLVLGVVVAAPLGPIGLLCIKRTLQNGIRDGLATGFGAAAADAFFGAIAAFGVTAALSLLAGLEKEIRFFGGLFLLVLGGIMLRRKVHIKRNGPSSPHTLISAAISGLLITLSNPLTIIGVLAVVAAFAGKMEYMEAATLTGGIFVGSLAWWLLLCGGTWSVRHHLTDNAMTWVNRGTAILLIVLAGWAVYTGVASTFGLPVMELKLNKPLAFNWPAH